MGRPFVSELEAISETSRMFFEYNVDRLYDSVKCSLNIPVLAIGSGGSFSVAKAFSLLITSLGGFAKAITPFDLLSENAISSCYVFLFTAGGNNPDTLHAYRYVKLQEPKGYFILCTNPESAIQKEMDRDHFYNYLVCTIPFGKDGFLAVNSTIGMLTLFEKVYGQFTKMQITKRNYQISTLEDSSFFSRKTIIGLNGMWSSPVIVDFESKCTEAGLVSVLPTDLRNFAHGRHHWIAKNQEESAIICFVSGDERLLAERTLGFLPEMPKVIVESEHNNYLAVLDFFPKMFAYVQQFGTYRKIDPGRPQVPAFGRKIYHVNHNLIKNNSKLVECSTNILSRAVARKISGLDEIGQTSIRTKYKAECKAYIKNITNTHFKGIILDYDNTVICDNDTHSPLYRDIINKLIELLENGVYVAFASGRGSSILLQLRKDIPHQFWTQIWISCYNGASTIRLSEEMQVIPENEQIKVLDVLLKQTGLFSCDYAYTNKHNIQITFFLEGRERKWCQDIVSELIERNGMQLICHTTDHSLDILSKFTSKKTLYDKMKMEHGDINILSIGDSGNLCGNDFLLLSQDYGMSSEHTSVFYDSCWNLAPLGYKGIQATHYYLSALSLKKGCFNINIKE